MQLVPTATMMRAHNLITASTIFREAVKRNINHDLSLFIPENPIVRFSVPTIHGNIERLSFNYMDSYNRSHNLEFNQSLSSSILVFHPVHIYNDIKIFNFLETLLEEFIFGDLMKYVRN